MAAPYNAGSSPNRTVLVDPVTGLDYTALPIAGGDGVNPSSASNPNSTVDAASSKVDRSITASSSNQEAAPANDSRRRLFIQNLDAAINVHVNIGAAATTGLGSLRLAPGASVELTGTIQSVNVIAVSGSPLVTVWEF